MRLAPQTCRRTSDRLRQKAAARLQPSDTISMAESSSTFIPSRVRTSYPKYLFARFPAHSNYNPSIPNLFPAALSRSPPLENSFPLLKLPAELRLMIYAYLVPQQARIGISNWADHVVQETQLSEKLGKDCLIGFSQPHDLSYLTVCKQMYLEICPLIYRDTNITIYMRYNEQFLRKKSTLRSEYTLRTRKVTPRGIMCPHILSRFRRIQINYSLPDMNITATNLSKDWKNFDAQLVEMGHIIAEGSKTNPFKSLLRVTFWEPSRLLFAFENTSNIYTTFLRSMHTLQDKVPPSRFNATFLMKKDVLNVAIPYSLHRHPLQLEVMAKEHKTMLQIQDLAMKGNVEVRAARDWRLCAFLSASGNWMSCSWVARSWDSIFLPPAAESAVSDASLVELIECAPEKVAGENWDGVWGDPLFDMGWVGPVL
ncbi:hypothetical protein EJ08DRAFT_452617 [Tothia fuscella]|uniref:Uncharacterized protein n=1 Tax=Tothia fuscella TaxID=1048955 RepID=A0A9P4NJ78_9PEZI|nr:hypothetical protein EJ08DRAFT_452617 [Tothia fuscella]